MINGLPLLPLPVVPAAATAPAAAAPADFMAVLAGTAAPVTPPLPATPVETPIDASPVELAPPAPMLPATPILPRSAPDLPVASALDLPAAAPPKPVAARDDDGETQVIALPWHLQANVGLSWASGVAGAATSPGHPATSASPPVLTASAGASGTAGNVGLALRPAAIDASAGTRPAPAMAMPRVTSGSNERSTAAGPTIGTDGWYAPWVAWPDRLLRWHAENDGSASAWVRDYRLDAGDAAQLVESLRELAGQQQLSLRRIVLNGHELWRAPSPQTPR